MAVAQEPSCLRGLICNVKENVVGVLCLRTGVEHCALGFSLGFWGVQALVPEHCAQGMVVDLRFVMVGIGNRDHDVEPVLNTAGMNAPP